MKTILKIITILIIASLVAGGFWLAFGSSSSTNSGQPTAIINGQTNFQPADRPDGGERDGSITNGLGGIFFTLVKITGIIAIVLLIEKLFSMKNTRKLSPAQR
jgi:hypothetical protein